MQAGGIIQRTSVSRIALRFRVQAALPSALKAWIAWLTV